MNTRTHVLLYEPRFAALVEGGAKLCTIRARRLATLKRGETLDHRAWVGVPYRAGSTQRTVRTSVCSYVQPIEIGGTRLVIVDGVSLTDAQVDALARADGFADRKELRDYFANASGLPFFGLLIAWQP